MLLTEQLILEAVAEVYVKEPFPAMVVQVL
jgi:hypothetical protein